MALIAMRGFPLRTTPSPQLAKLRKAECARIFQETASGANRDRPQLVATLDYMREGDTLVVWKLDPPPGR